MTSLKKTRPRVVLVNRSIVINDEGKVLLIQRSEGDIWGAGRWEFPGGKLDEGQDVANALEREVLEETGLFVIPTNRIVYYESLILTQGKYRGLPYVVLIGISKVVGGEVKLSEEHQNFLWATISEALELDLTDETRKSLLTLKDSKELSASRRT